MPASYEKKFAAAPAQNASSEPDATRPIQKHHPDFRWPGEYRRNGYFRAEFCSIPSLPSASTESNNALTSGLRYFSWQLLRPLHRQETLNKTIIHKIAKIVKIIACRSLSQRAPSVREFPDDFSQRSQSFICPDLMRRPNQCGFPSNNFR